MKRALGVWVGWLLVSTVLLNQPLMDGWINRKPERVHVGWDLSLPLLRPWLARWKGLDASGKGWLEAQLRLQDGRIMPESQLDFVDAQLRLAALGHQLDARVDGELQRVDGELRQRRLTLQSLQMRGPDGTLLPSDADAFLELTQAGATLMDAPILTLRMGEVALPNLRVINHYLVFKDLHVELGRLSYRQAGGPPGSNGWLRLHVPQARAVIGTPMHLDGAARLAMANLRLLLEMYAQRSDMPRWLLRLADKGQVDATGHFRFADGALALDNVCIKNDRYTVNAEPRLARDNKRGRLLFEWSRLAVGISMAGGKNQIHLRHARDWYQGPSH